MPAHAPRKETRAYKAIHHQMVVVEDKACVGCGVRNSTLKDPIQNPHGAKALETHHKEIEWSLANAIDLAQFNKLIVAWHRAKDDSHDPIYDQDFTQQQMLDWIDHHRDNLWVICDVHHRHPLVGIHMVTYPIWRVQDLLKPGYRYTPANGGTH